MFQQPTTKNVSLEMNDKLMKSLRILRVTKNGTKLTKVCMRIRINLYYIVWNALADNSVFSFCSYQGYVLATSGSEEDKNGSLLKYFSKENIRIWTHEVDMISRLAYSGGNENILTSSWHGKGKLKITKVFFAFSLSVYMYILCNPIQDNQAFSLKRVLNFLVSSIQYLVYVLSKISRFS